MDQAPDEQLAWSAALAGDGRAFARLFALHRDRVFGHVVRLVPALADADDVTAAAFFELWRRRERVRIVDGSVLPWLLVTAANLARNTERGLRRYRATLDRMPRGRDETDPGELAADRIDGRVSRDRLAAGLRAMSATDASLVLLTAFEGYTVQRAARELGLTDGAARVRLHRARTRLRGALEPAAIARTDQEVSG